MSTLGMVRREIDRATQKLSALIRRGLLTLSTGDYFVQAECYDGERYDNVELWQQFGLTSRPVVGGEVLLVKVGGRGEGAIAIVTTDRASRPTGLSEGDSVHYGKKSSAGQARAHAKADGHYDVHAGKDKTVNIGGDATSCIDFLLKGTTFDGALRLLLDGPQGLATWVKAIGVGFTAAGKGFAAIQGDGSVQLTKATKQALKLSATACETAATACTTFALGIKAFLGGSYLAKKGKVC